MSDWDLSNVSSVLCIFVNSVIDNNSNEKKILVSRYLFLTGIY